MNKMRVGVICAAAALVLLSPRSEATDLASLIPNLFTQDIFLRDAPMFSHRTHFVDEGARLQATGNALNQALVVQLATVPLSSPSGGFTYVYEPRVGGFRRGSESFGPLFVERANTVGRGRWNFGISYLSAKYDSIDDIDLDTGELAFQLVHEDVSGDGTSVNFFFEGDLIGVNTFVEVENEITSVFFNYGVTNRFDIAVAIPLVSVDLTARAVLTVDRRATGAGSPIHRFEEDPNQEVFSDSDSASGLGDVLIRGKVRFHGQGDGLALAVDVRLPTGDEKDLLGTGATQTKLFFIGSDTWGKFSPHFNAGYTFSSGSSDLVKDLPDEINYALGFDIAMTPRWTFAADVIGRTLRDATRLVSRPQEFDFCARRSTAPGPPVCAPGAASTSMRPELQAVQEDLDLLMGSAGFRINPGGNFLISPFVLFSLSDEGLQDEGIIPVISIDFSF